MSTCAADEVDGGVVAGLWHDDPLVRLLARQVRLSGERVRSSVIVSYLRTTASTKTSLSQRLSRHARSRWPALAKVQLRFWAQFAYVDGLLPDGQVLPLYGHLFPAQDQELAEALDATLRKELTASHRPGGAEVRRLRRSEQ